MTKPNISIEKRLSKLSIIIVTHEFATGQAQRLAMFLSNKVLRMAFIGHPFSFSQKKRSHIELYEKGKVVQKIKAPAITSPEPVLYLKHIFFTVFFILKIKKRFDIYYGANNLNAFVGVLFRRMGFIDVVIFNTVDYVPNRFRNRILNGIYHALDRFCCYHSDFVWNLSPSMAKGRLNKGMLEERSAPQIVVPIGCDFGRIKRLPLKQINRFSMVYMGILHEDKGVEFIVDAMPKILEAVHEAKLIIVGTGPLEKFLKERVKRMKLENHVEFKGFIDDHSEVESILSKCALGLAPYVPNQDTYTRYADPGKPKQYMASGLPVIITRVPRIAYEIEKRNAGIAINFDESELITAVTRLMKNDQLYKKCRKNAIHFASEYEWDRIFAEAFSKLFQNN